MDKTAYFKSRGEMGRRIAEKLSSLKGTDTAILALSPGACLIAIEIARQLHSTIGLLLTSDILLPDDRTIVGVVNNRGHFTRDVKISEPQMEEFEMEYRNALSRSKASAVSELHKSGHRDRVRPEFYKNKIVIMVHDVTHSGTIFKAGEDFLRSVRTDGQILVSAVAKFDAQYYMQEHGDAYVIEHLTDKDLPADHYFEDDIDVEQSQVVALLKESAIVRF